MKRTPLIIAIVALVLAIAGGAYYWWTTTPMYAFQEAGVSVVGHDLTHFRSCVDQKTLVDSALQDLFFGPLERMPDVPEPKKQVMNGALGLLKIPLTEALVKQIEGYVDNAPAKNNTSTAETSPPAAPAEQAPQSPVEMLKAKLGAVAQEKAQDLKKNARQKMQDYAANHPESLVGRILSMPQESRWNELGKTLTEYGFEPKSFKGIAFSKEPTANTCTVGAKFFSKKLNKDLILDVDLTKTGEASWQISRLSNLGDLIKELEPGYDNDLQQLALYSTSEVRNAVAKNIQEGQERLKEKIREGIKEGVKERITDKLDSLKERLKERAAERPNDGNFPGPPGPPGPPRLPRLRRFGPGQ